MADTPQTFANHTRRDPVYLSLAALIVVAFVQSVIIFVHHPGMRSAVLIVLTIALLLNSAMTRGYSLKVQNRVIRMEERMRLALLLPDAVKPRIADLTVSQLVALRFASDAELPGLAVRALDEGLTNKQIKQSIQSWRPDTFRV